MSRYGVPYVRGSATSEAAAQSQEWNSLSDEAKVYAFILSQAENGATDSEIEVSLGLLHQTASARRNSLMKKSLIRDSGKMRLTSSRRPAVVWIAAKYGISNYKRGTVVPEKQPRIPMSDMINSVDDFLSHSNAERSGFLSKWKKNTPPKVNVFLHTRRLPTALWQHGFPKIFTKEDKDTGEMVTHVWGGKFTCHETEAVLLKQYKRDNDGERTHPPRSCPMCKLVETVRSMVEEGQLSWTTPIFEFEGDISEESQIIHAGGLYNAFGQRDMPEDKKREMKKAGISPMEAWKENALAKMSYIFCVVDTSAVNQGVQIATETSLLGDKVKEVINDAMEDQGKEQGNPFLNPFCIQWEYKPDEKEFGKKYRARRMESIKLTPEIAKLIRGEAPDLSNIVAPFNPKILRASLERYCLVQNIPWDHIFDGAREIEEEPTTSHKQSAARTKLAAPPATLGKLPPTPAAKPPVLSEDEDDIVECDGLQGVGGCGEAMNINDAKCGHCGFVYDAAKLAAEAPPPPPPAKLRKRGEAKKSAPPPPVAAKEEAESDDFSFGDDDSDEIPF